MTEITSSAVLPLSEIPVCIADFDGVFHPDSVFYTPGVGIHLIAEGHHLFEWCDILVALLAPYPDVKIVLSTSWVRARSYEFAKSKLPETLRERVIGATFHNRELQKAEFDLMSRGGQVASYVERRKVKRWFAIDNDAEGWPTWCYQKLVKTQDNLGLSEPAVQRLIQDMLRTL